MISKVETMPARVPTPEQVDAAVRAYADAQKDVTALKTAAGVAQEKSDAAKQRVIEMVKTHGQRHAEKSMRLVGIHTKATVTTGTRTTTDTGRVDELRAFLGKQEVPDLAGRFFREHVSYSLVEGPQDVLTTLSLGTKLRNKIQSLLGLCFRIETNAPSLKVEVTEAEKPATAKAG